MTKNKLPEHAKGKKPSKKPSMPRDMSIHERVEQIKNGYLKHVTISHTDDSGAYHSNTETTHHRVHPGMHSRVKGLMKKHGMGA